MGALSKGTVFTSLWIKNRGLFGKSLAYTSDMSTFSMPTEVLHIPPA